MSSMLKPQVKWLKHKMRHRINQKQSWWDLNYRQDHQANSQMSPCKETTTTKEPRRVALPFKTRHTPLTHYCLRAWQAVYGWLVCGCVVSLVRSLVNITQNECINAKRWESCSHASTTNCCSASRPMWINSGRRWWVGCLCVCHLSVCIYLFDRLLVCGESVARLCCAGRGSLALIMAL